MGSLAWHVYALSPIDYGWDNLQTLNGLLKRWINDTEIMALDERQVHCDIKQLIVDWDQAQKIALENGWNGQLREGFAPRIFWLPGPGRFTYGFVFKQDANGTTFVISPQPLPGLKESTVGQKDS